MTQVLRRDPQRSDGTRPATIATALRAGFTAFARTRGWRAR